MSACLALATACEEGSGSASPEAGISASGGKSGAGGGSQGEDAGSTGSRSTDGGGAADSDDGGGESGSGTDAGDAGGAGVRGGAGGDGGVSGGAGGACSGPNECHATFPCVNVGGGDYVCRGLFPEWQDVGAVGPYTTTANTVIDFKTEMQWQRSVDGGTHTQPQAVSYCDNLVLAGYSDWRLPSITELESIIDDSVVAPAIDTTAFPMTPAAPFWTTSPYASPVTLGFGWIVDFYDGSSSIRDMTLASHVRCVR